jgi:uncharacterized protein (TIGR03435 family)
MRLPPLKSGAILMAGLFGLSQLPGQVVLPKAGEALPSFEVSTIRKSAEGGRNMRIQFSEDVFRTDNVALRTVIRMAYGLTSTDQVLGGPDALLDTHFDINAKAEAADVAATKKLTREDQRRHNELMLQSLLADRFGLKVHSDTRELPVYNLVIAKGGSKLKESAPEPEEKPDADTPPTGGADAAPRHSPRGGMMISMSSNKVEMTASAGTMETMATMLTNQPDAGGRQVIDKTGLTGKYDWKLTWTPTTGMAMRGMDNGTKEAGADLDAPGLFTALEEELGLKLEPAKGQVPVVVVDHVEAPSAN